MSQSINVTIHSRVVSQVVAERHTIPDLIDMLTHLDNKYRQQFDEYLKNSGFEAIN